MGQFPETPGSISLNRTAPPKSTDIIQAAWSGKHFFVWGGDNYSAAINTGGKYNPDTNTWETITTTGAPGARSFNVLVWTRHGMVVWGGTTALGGGASLSNGGIYK